jgi:hypothetical protein
VAQHLQQMRLAAAEEAAHPGAALARPPEIVQERTNDLLDAVRVLPFTHKGRQLTAELGKRAFALTVGNPRLSLIDERVSSWIALQDILDLHAHPPSPCSVIGTAR